LLLVGGLVLLLLAWTVWTLVRLSRLEARVARAWTALDTQLQRRAGLAQELARDYPAAVGSYMTNTDSTPFMEHVAAISVRENERGTQIGAGWNPHWHQPTDLYSSYSDKDFLLGLNAAQTTLAAMAQLAGAKVRN